MVDSSAGTGMRNLFPRRGKKESFASERNPAADFLSESDGDTPSSTTLAEGARRLQQQSNKDAQHSGSLHPVCTRLVHE